MIEGLDKDEYLAWNYDFFRVHRVIPKLTVAKRKTFRLKDLQVAELQNNPAFGRSVLATLLQRLYDSLWIIIDSPQDILIHPGSKTMWDLAAHCHTSAKEKHPEGLAPS
jgi:hypothetical protein